VIYPDSSVQVDAPIGVTVTSDVYEVLLSTPVTTGAQNTVFLIDAVCNATIHGGAGTNIRFRLDVDGVTIREGKISGFQDDTRPVCFTFSERVEVPTLGGHTVDFLWCVETSGDKAATNEFASLRVRGVVR